MEKDKTYVQIGEVAERTGLTCRTLRFYEEKGLLTPPSRMEGGFRLYSPEDVERIQHIVQLRDLLGVTLADIKEMIEAEEFLNQIKAEYRQAADVAVKRDRLRRAIQIMEGQIEVMDRKIAQLSQMRDSWQEKSARYRERMHELEATLGVPSLVGSADAGSAS